MGYGSVFTLLADIRDEFSFTSGQVGIIAAAGLATGVASQSLLARYSDRGYAIIMMRMGLAFATAGMLWMVFATQFWEWTAARLILGLGSGMVGPAVRRIVITRDPQNLGINLGRQTSFDVAGFILGPVVAAGLSTLFGLRAPFLFLCITYAIVIPLVARIAPDHDTTASDTPHRVRELLRLPAVQSTIMAAVAFYLTIGMFEALWAILLSDLDAPTWLIGVTLSLFTMPMLVFAPKGGALAQRKGPINIVTLSVAVAAFSTFIYGVSPLWVIIIFSGIHAVADAYTMPANQVAMAIASPPEQIAAGQGLLGAIGLAVAAVSALAGAAIYDAYGRTAIFTGTAIAMMICVLIARQRWRAQPALADIVD